MSGVRAVGNLALAERVTRTERSEPSIVQLEDILYEIVASGVDPDAAEGALDAVQVLLHEHARNPKSHADLLTFFQRYRLPLSVERLSSGVSAVLVPPIELQELPARQHELATEEALAMAAATAGQARRMAMPGAWTWAALAGALLALGAVLGLGYATLQDMRSELGRVRGEAAAQAASLVQVKHEAETLRGGLRENSAWVRRVDQKSDLLMRSLSPLDPAPLDPALSDRVQ